MKVMKVFDFICFFLVVCVLGILVWSGIMSIKERNYYNKLCKDSCQDHIVLICQETNDHTLLAICDDRTKSYEVSIHRTDLK